MSEMLQCHFCHKPIAPEDLHHHHVVPRADGGPVDGATVPCHRICHHQFHREAGHYAAWTRAQYAERLAMFGPEETHRLLAHWGRQGYLAATNGNSSAWHRAGGLARVANGRNEKGQFVPVAQE
jgi:hypothetical protein